MDDVFVIWISEDLRGGTTIVAFEAIGVERRLAEDIVQLFDKPGHLRAR